MRIDKFLSNTGFGTRNEVKKLIKNKNVTVNGKIITKSSTNINEEKDDIKVDGNLAEYRKYIYLMLNKPKGCISATTSYKEKTVLDYIDSKHLHYDLFPMGRLDKDTEGLLIITNDGKLSHEVLSPKKHVSKKYFAQIAGVVKDSDIIKFKEGLDIGEKTLTKPAILDILSVDTEKETSEIEVTITEGKYHQVKRMFEAIDCKVTYLKRTKMGRLGLDTNLELGEFRELREEEIEMLTQTEMG